MQNKLDDADDQSSNSSNQEWEMKEPEVAVANFDDLPTDDSGSYQGESDTESDSSKESDADSKNNYKGRAGIAEKIPELTIQERLMKRREEGIGAEARRMRQERQSALELTRSELRKQAKSKREEKAHSEDSDSEGRSHEDEVDRAQTRGGKKAKRSKHAPIEVSSTKAAFYQRSRNLGASGINSEVLGTSQRYKPRDPRMSDLITSKSSLYKAEKDYAFLNDIIDKEVELYKKRIKSWKINGPNGMRARQKLGLDPTAGSEDQIQSDKDHLKKLIQQQAERKRNEAQMSAKYLLKKNAAEKVAQGKSVYYPKRQERKKMELEATFDELRKRGGDRAVDKAVAKKRRKNAQKEHRNLPMPKNSVK